MNRETLQRELARFDPKVPIAASWTPPASWYLEPEFLELEKQAIFLRSWQPVGRVDQVEQPGQFFSGRLVGQPYVVLRDVESELRAFYNVCCHHAAEVMQDSGCASELVCPYHGWTYALDGRLRSAPRLGRVEEFNVEDFALKPIRVETWGPFVYLNFDPRPRSLAEDLAPLYDRLRASGFEQLRFVARREYALQCNWKVYVDNYLDGGYHVAHLHHGLAGQLDLDAYRTEIFPRFSIQSCTSGEEEGGEGCDFAERVGEGAIYAWLYPNFMINRYGSIMDTNWVVPLGPDRTLTVFDYYFTDTDGATAEEFIDKSLAASHQVQLEDVGICESVQVGLASHAYDQGRYAPSVEMGEYHFHSLLREKMDHFLTSEV